MRLQLKFYKPDGAPHSHPAGMQVARTLEAFDERFVRIASSEFADGQVLTTVKELSGGELNSDSGLTQIPFDGAQCCA